ncbi:Uncharacterized protein QTN25_003038 [Entamoeba marina]
MCAYQYNIQASQLLFRYVEYFTTQGYINETKELIKKFFDSLYYPSYNLKGFGLGFVPYKILGMIFNDETQRIQLLETFISMITTHVFLKDYSIGLLYIDVLFDLLSSKKYTNSYLLNCFEKSIICLLNTDYVTTFYHIQSCFQTHKTLQLSISNILKYPIFTFFYLFSIHPTSTIFQWILDVLHSISSQSIVYNNFFQLFIYFLTIYENTSFIDTITIDNEITDFLSILKSIQPKTEIVQYFSTILDSFQKERTSPRSLFYKMYNIPDTISPQSLNDQNIYSIALVQSTSLCFFKKIKHQQIEFKQPSIPSLKWKLQSYDYQHILLSFMNENEKFIQAFQLFEKQSIVKSIRSHLHCVVNEVKCDKCQFINSLTSSNFEKQFIDEFQNKLLQLQSLIILSPTIIKSMNELIQYEYYLVTTQTLKTELNQWVNDYLIKEKQENEYYPQSYFLLEFASVIFFHQIFSNDSTKISKIKQLNWSNEQKILFFNPNFIHDASLYHLVKEYPDIFPLLNLTKWIYQCNDHSTLILFVKYILNSNFDIVIVSQLLILTIPLIYQEMLIEIIEFIFQHDQFHLFKYFDTVRTIEMELTSITNVINLCSNQIHSTLFWNHDIYLIKLMIHFYARLYHTVQSNTKLQLIYTQDLLYLINTIPQTIIDDDIVQLLKLPISEINDLNILHKVVELDIMETRSDIILSSFIRIALPITIQPQQYNFLLNKNTISPASASLYLYLLSPTWEQDTIDFQFILSLLTITFYSKSRIPMFVFDRILYFTNENITLKQLVLTQLQILFDTLFKQSNVLSSFPTIKSSNFSNFFNFLIKLFELDTFFTSNNPFIKPLFTFIVNALNQLSTTLSFPFNTLGQLLELFNNTFKSIITSDTEQLDPFDIIFELLESPNSLLVNSFETQIKNANLPQEALQLFQHHYFIEQLLF